jgi:PAS domain S-box-containing protein
LKAWDTYWLSWSADVQAQFRRALRQALDGTTQRFDAQVRMAGGTLMWIDVQIAPLRDENGHVTHLVASAMDLSPRKKAEEALAEREARFHDLFSSIDEGYCLCEMVVDGEGKPVDYRFLEVNPLFEQMTGLSDPVGRTARELVPSLENNWFEIYGRVASTGESLRFENDSVAMGRVFDVLAMPAKPRGRFVVVFKDITARRQAEEALRQSEQRYRNIFENSPTGISIADLSGRFSACNPAYETITGFTQAELRHRVFSDLVHPEDRAFNVEQVRRVAEGELPVFDVLNRSVRKDGRIVWLQKYVTVLRDASGKPVSLLALVTDVTQNKAYEEHKQLLMSEVNHRAKNILSLVQAVARQTAASNATDFVARFSERIQSLAASHDLLVKNEWRGADLPELVTSQLAHFADLIGTRIVIDGSNLHLTPAAAQTIGMAIHELATNAGKHGALSNDAGTVTIAWTIQRDDPDEETFRLSWQERGGPAVTPPARRGFGSIVIGSMTKSSLDADVQLDWAPAGLAFLLACPASKVTQFEGHRTDPRDGDAVRADARAQP